MEDWQSREGLMKGQYASDVILLGWHPGHTRHAVAIDLGEGQGIQIDRGQQTLVNCRSRIKGSKCLHTFRKTKLRYAVIFNVRKTDKRMYLQVHLLYVVLHSRPV